MFEKRFQNHNLSFVVRHLENQMEQKTSKTIKQLVKQQKMHRSCINMHKKEKSKIKFNNKTKQGELFCPRSPQVPYLFIPKYKSDALIMPDRAFQKGEAAKRRTYEDNAVRVKMKDTSNVSFRDEQDTRFQKVLRKEEKQKIISGRKMEQLNKILTESDGCFKCKNMKEKFQNEFQFHYSSRISGNFNPFAPILSPKDQENIEIKKISLAKASSFKKWNPVSKKKGQLFCNSLI